MRCPNRKCRRQTDRLLIKVDGRGKKSEGCHACIGGPQTVNVRTGKKIWAGTDVDGVKGNREKIEAFGEKLANRAAQMRRKNSFRLVQD